MKSLYVFLASLLCIFGSTEVFAQYKVGDYYVNGNIKGVVFYVNNDEGTLAILKTEMDGRYESYGIGDMIGYEEEEFIIQYANEPYPYNVWDIPTARMARLINQNFRVVRETAIKLGFRGLPTYAHYQGRVGFDGTQRLIPVFFPKYTGSDGDIFSTETIGALVKYGCGVLLYGIVDYTTGTMRKIE